MYYMLSLFAVASSSGISPRYNICIMLSFVILKCICNGRLFRSCVKTLKCKSEIFCITL